MTGLFVTGTGTGVGKTVLSAALLAAIAAEDEPVAAYKPAVTGLAEPGAWPADHELLAELAGMAPEEVAPLQFDAAASPPLAAELAGERIDGELLLANAAAALRSSAERGATLIVEGVGGLFCPLAENMTVCDLATALRLPLLIAASPELGTINHTLLTLQAARAASLNVRAVVLTPWPAEPSLLQQSNLAAITQLGFVEVDTLAPAGGPQADELARVGALLPWRRWLDLVPARG